MMAKYANLLCVAVAVAVLTAVLSGCPKNDTNTGTPAPATASSAPAPVQAVTSADAAKGAETPAAPATKTPAEPKIWSVEGVADGEPILLAPNASTVLEFTFELAPKCHFGDNEPLRITLADAGGLKAVPAEFKYAKPAEVPKAIQFKLSGAAPGASGELKFDFEANYCSDEGFCVRMPDKMALKYKTDAAGAKPKYTVKFVLDPNA